jgi:hypothetical protein
LSYPATKAHSISCFIHVCGLSEILIQVLISFYSPNRNVVSSSSSSSLATTPQRALLWRKEVVKKGKDTHVLI